MSEGLQVGLRGESRFEVSEDMSPVHLPVKVLSTPSMIQLIEMTCLQTVQPRLESSQTTVGTHVNVSHSGPASAGEEIVVQCELQSIEGRRLTFGVEVLSPRGTISKGTHQRAVIDAGRFAKG